MEKRLSKAQPTITKIEDAHLHLVVEIPDFKNLKDAAEYYDNDAQDIAECLIDTLAGGVLDRLIAKLLIYKASLLRVPYGDK